MSYIATAELTLRNDDFEKLGDIGDRIYEERRKHGFLGWVPVFSKKFTHKVVRKLNNDMVLATYRFKYADDEDMDVLKKFVSEVPHKLLIKGEDGHVFVDSSKEA